MSEPLSRQELARLEQLFERAVELPRAQQAAFVAAECGSNEALRHELTSLLDALESDDRLDAIRREAPSRSGTRIGPYLLMERIGEGGMGEVYAAERQGPIARRVALKIVKPGMDSRQVLARFEVERQALARMAHPNIAQVFDGGTTESGSPYFVMELVEGEPITEHCDRHKLSTRQRLELFLGVCAGVQHAHQKGIIHRDLKPSNLLVAQRDGSALPKIIDFGIARAMSGDLVERSLYTLVGQIVGTLDYMSPEQADPTSVEIDTRSDIYSLGVVLYQMLCGLLPFEHHRAGDQPLSEIQRAIREKDPPTPSTNLRRQGDTAMRVAPLRGTDERTLVRQLAGDLDWICMRALEKDPARRYATVNALAQDLQRHLDGQPVTAAPPSAAYRVRKFARRNRVPVITASVLLVAGVSSLVAVLAATARAHAAGEAAARSSQITDATSEFVRAIFLSHESTTVGDLLDNALRDIESGRFRDFPENEASLQSTLAGILRDKGRSEEAVQLSSQALETYRGLYPGGSREEARSLGRLATAMLYRDPTADVESMLSRAVQMYESEAPEDLAGRAWAITTLGHCFEETGRLAEAEALYARGLELRMSFNAKPEDRAISLYSLARARDKLGLKEEAREGFNQAIALLRTTDSPYLAAGLWYSGKAHLDNGDAAAALPELEEALKIAESVYPSGGPDVWNIERALEQCRAALGE